MAISSDVAKDPKAVKTKFIGSFTKRQFICFVLAAIVGVPFYFMVRGSLGTDVAVLLMMAVMMPFFFAAMYEKDGVPAEKYLMQIISMRVLRPGIRRYKAENIYEEMMKREKMKKEVEALENKKHRWKESKAGNKTKVSH